MKKFFLSLCCLLIAIIIVSNALHAQSFVIDDVKKNDFRGIYEIEGVGYYACYKQKGDYELHLLDYDLKPVKKSTTGQAKSRRLSAQCFQRAGYCSCPS